MFNDKKRIEEDLTDTETSDEENLNDTDQVIDMDEDIQGEKGGSSSDGEIIEEDTEATDEGYVPTSKEYDEDLQTIDNEF